MTSPPWVFFMPTYDICTYLTWKMVILRMLKTWDFFCTRSRFCSLNVQLNLHNDSQTLTPVLILHGGNGGDCLHAHLSLPWCPCIYNILIGSPLPRRKCLGALAHSKTKHRAYIPIECVHVYYCSSNYNVCRWNHWESVQRKSDSFLSVAFFLFLFPPDDGHRP